MLAMDNNGASSETTTKAESPTSDLAKQAQCFYSHNVGVTFKDNNSIAQNAIILDKLDSIPPEEITKENGETTFPINTQDFAHFMHLVYCHTSAGMKLRVEFDGIFPFDAPDEQGTMQSFNAQLVSISEIEVS